jgi:hypothetical protein
MNDTDFHEIATTPESLHAAINRGYAHGKATLANGERVLVTVGPALEPIRVKQRAFLKDIVFGQISEQVKVPTFNADGSATGKYTRYTKAVWAEIFRMELLGDRYEMKHAVVRDKATGKVRIAKRATPHKVRNSTEELGVRKYSEYTDTVIDKAVVEYGVEFHFTRDERKAVRHRPAKAKPKEEANA